MALILWLLDQTAQATLLLTLVCLISVTSHAVVMETTFVVSILSVVA
jgi:hypothetical protein